MADLHGKKIILGISGSIAAYKSAFLTRLLVKAGASVRVLMTPAAAQFISPLTLSTLSKNPVYSDVQSEAGWNNHVELGLWADAMIIAPATANTLARLAGGICDNMLSAVYLSARCPVFFAPAMDVDMWHHPATQENLRKLRTYGNEIIPVEHGELASGLVGEGRMAEPETIVAFLTEQFLRRQDLAGKKVLITAGPTYEAIDPVRFIGNRSSGKMGIAIAEEAASRGARVTLVLGPSALRAKHPGIDTIHVESAREMYVRATAQFPECDIAVLSAAVADYRPVKVADQKLKKEDGTPKLELERTPDIAAALGEMKQAGQRIIGFALETNNETANARKKLEKKNFDLIVLNSLRDAGAGFQHDTNKISILSQDNKTRHFELKTKAEVAKDIINTLLPIL
ncbi:bifunctional phosphopantothenoylcysteine decarboxylase/phosphopantothenate--cysteine ligase CoaBC [Flavilitoribacter nigricans]|uniref:Coenzyme A biosynthesis bifunctional protein CoaBC n=1 Tax=Flavilitoribacter nigricans (strain ATCC 23147 / DSM 23189 / NBRC 102662 / NCIMB 1420 / SS-2) TaxID=1122177 RepID=A0A2D0N9E9_FLAN2|nr:bifunctional phosphopantothenoylcysteine decarboxylase/phosphopantothenate--cysteine ligase CoaBC [Flavilitoribacter nigricans]PHN04403.1 bifunctional phosphopantothenoylcysteine decarboxylase/phosphopantothenate--cysteine ligase CoaBC [Flavilitoribacter nigricans DSM 23189 = NBRC 102662]